MKYIKFSVEKAGGHDIHKKHEQVDINENELQLNSSLSYAAQAKFI